MQDNYFDYYILSYFKMEKVTRISQILHVLRGKRTPSMFYLTEINNWHHGFSIEKRIDRKELEEIINHLLQGKLLVEKEIGYLLTALGQQRLKEYFEQHYLPNKIIRFSNLGLRRSFWNRLQLFTQVFSEYSYQNLKYIPIVKDPMHQESVRQLFQAAEGNMDSIFKHWINEQELLFKQMEETKADVLVNFLTGHENVGKTKVQLAKVLQMQGVEFDFYLRDLLEELIEIIKENKNKLPLIYKILKQTNQEVFLGLSQSTYQSYELLKRGADIQQIAHQRYIKENTVKEHILEMAFILDEFPVQYFVPKQIYEHLNHQFESQKDYSFREAVTANETLDFYQYRLVELERMRSN